MSIKLARHLTITLPDWVSYAAVTPEGIQHSPEVTFRSVPDGLLLQAGTLEAGEGADVAVHDSTSFLGAIPNPRSADFPLVLFAETREKRALRHIEGGTLKRLNLTKRSLQDGVLVIDHEFTIIVAGNSKQSTHRHDVFMFYGDNSAVLEIGYSMDAETKWGSALKAAALSFQVVK